jgi:hypothetical protein
MHDLALVGGILLVDRIEGGGGRQHDEKTLH